MTTDPLLNESQRVRLFYDPYSLSSFNKYRVFHTHFDLIVDFDSNILDGYVQLDIKQLNAELCDRSSTITCENKEIPNNHGTKLVLDFRHLNIKKVLLIENNDEQILTFHTDTLCESLIIEINEMSSDSIISIRIYYSTLKAKCTALQWLTKEQTANKQYPYMFSQCQAVQARSLYPCQDTPGVKSTYTAKITCSKPLTVLMSSLRTNYEEDTNTFYFEQNQPVPPYSVAIAVGYLLSYDLSLRIRVWTEPSMLEQCQYEFEDAEQFLTAAEQVLGEYKWKRYDFLVLPPSFPYGCTGNPCMNFICPTLLTGDRSLASTIIHEMTRSWIENSVTIDNWEHFWLNEGFTSFIEAKILGYLDKTNEDEVRKFHAAQQWQNLKNTIDTYGLTHPYTCLVSHFNNINFDIVYNSVQESKGVAVLWHLEQNIVRSESDFHAFLISYITAFGHRSLNTDDFVRHFEHYFPKVSSVDWQSWLYTSGMPPVTCDFTTKLEKHCRQLANQQTSITKEQINSLTTKQIAYLLNLLLDKQSIITYDYINQIDINGDMSKYTNCDIRFRWYQLCIRVKYDKILEDLCKFLEMIGRTRFVKPLYSEFKISWPEMMPRVQKIFDEYERTESLMEIKIIHHQIILMENIVMKFNVRKKKEKYSKVVEHLQEATTQLISEINNCSMITVRIREEYNEVIKQTNAEFRRIGQVVQSQEDCEIEREFESVEMQYQLEKAKKKEKESFSTSGTSTGEPRVGEVYRLNIGLHAILEDFGCSLVNIDSSSSSNSTSTSSHSSRKEGKLRPCLVWKRKVNKFEVLPIASFGGKQLSHVTHKNFGYTTTSSSFLYDRVIPIEPIQPLPPHQTALAPTEIRKMLHPLRGHLILIPVLMNNTSWADRLPVVFNRENMIYIKSRLLALETEEDKQQDRMINSIDIQNMSIHGRYDKTYDPSSESSTSSIPVNRTNVFDNGYDKYQQVQSWINKYSDSMVPNIKWERITDIDQDPDHVKREMDTERKEEMDLNDEQRRQQLIADQIKRDKEKGIETPTPVYTEFVRKDEEEKVQVSFNSNVIAEKKEVLPPSVLTTINKKRVNIDDEENIDESVSRTPLPKKTALNEVREMEETLKEQNKRQDYWLHENIIVKIVTTELGEKYYNKNGIITEVENRYQAVIKIIDTNDKLRIDQVHVETVIPAIGKKVLVVNGAYQGQQATLEDIHQESFSVDITLLTGSMTGTRIENMVYEDVSKLAEQD